MKKILLIVFVLTFVVSFTSCRDKREQDRAKYQVEKVKKTSMMPQTKFPIRQKTALMQ